MTPQELLANIPLFESLTDDDVDALASRLESVEYGEGDVIFCQGDEGSSLFVVDDGAVEISYGEGKTKFVLASLFPGQYFGELSLFDGAPRSATATALKRSRLIRLHRDALVEFVNGSPAAALRIIGEMSERLEGVFGFLGNHFEETDRRLSRSCIRHILRCVNDLSVTVSDV